MRELSAVSVSIPATSSFRESLHVRLTRHVYTTYSGDKRVREKGGDGASHYGGGVSAMVDVGGDGSCPGCHRGGGVCGEHDGGRDVVQLLLTAARVRARVPVRCRCSLPRGRWRVCEEGKPPHAQVFVLSAWDDVGRGGYIAGGIGSRSGTFVAPARQKQRREVAA